jgi:hypothetical protein
MARSLKDPAADALSGLSKVIQSQSTPDQSKVQADTFAGQIKKTLDRVASNTVRLYGIGPNATALSSDLEGVKGVAKALNKVSEITFADVDMAHTRFIPQPMLWNKEAMAMQPDPSNPDRWELDHAKATQAGILENLKRQTLEYEKPTPVEHPHADFGKNRLSTSARAANATRETPWENSGNVDRSAVFTGRAEGDIPDLNNPPRFTGPTTTADRAASSTEEARRIVEDIAGTGGGRIPPGPPGGNDTPGPPDEPEDDDNILNRLLEFFQRMFGLRPDTDNRSFLDTLANNLTSILGGVPAQAGADGQRPSAITTLMDTFADYFNVPRETEDATRQAQETLRRSIDRLTDATNSAANGGTPAQPQGRFARFRSFFRRGRGRRGGIATATRIARFMRPVLNRLGNMVPAPLRQAAGQIGVNTVTQIAGRFGVPQATAARFGTALGPAAIGIGVLAYGLPLLGSGIKLVINGLNKLSDEALKTTFALASYGGLLAHANAQLEMNREMRKIDMANRMGEFGAARLGQVNRLENAMQPWQIMGNNAGNLWGAVIDSALATLLEQINGLIATGMDIQAILLKLFVPGDQGEAQMREAARLLRNPAAAMPNPWQAQDALFGQNGVDAIDFARRQRGPRPPNNGGN